MKRVIIGLELEHHAMDTLNDNEILVIEKAIQQIEPLSIITKIDYEKGLITVGIVHNKGTMDEFVERCWLEVNVSCESVACLTWEVINKVFKNAM